MAWRFGTTATLRKWLIGASVALLLAGAAACAPQAPAAQPGAGQPAPAKAAPPPTSQQPAAVKTGGTLTVAMSAELATLELHNDTATQPASMREPLYDTLSRFNEKGQLEPGLATSWEAAPDAKSWTFKLRPGVKFHDGTTFDSNAVKVNFDRLLGGSPTAAKNILQDIKKVEVVDGNTVRFSTDAPMASLPNLIAHVAGGMMSPAAIDKWGKDLGLHPVGTGPFKFVEWVKGDHLTYERNPNYWEADKIKLDKIVFRFVKDASTRVAQLEAGETDVAEVLPPQEIERLASNKNVALVRTEGVRSYWYWMNTTRPPFDKQQVRQALNHGVDKEIILKTIMKGIATGPATTMQPPHSSDWVEGKGYEYNPEKAKQLLKEAGYPNGFETTLWVPSGIYPRDKEVAQAVVDQLGKIGVKVNLKFFSDLTGYLASLKNDDMEMAFISFANGTLDSNNFLTRNYLSSLSATPFNYSRVKNPRLDDLIMKARSAVKDSDRKAIYKEIQGILDDQAYEVLLVYLTNVTGARSNVQGIQMIPNEWLIVRYASKG